MKTSFPTYHNSHTYPLFTIESTKPFDEWEIPRDHLVIGSRIGEGEFGLILEGMLRTGKNTYRWLKRVLNQE